MIIQEYVELMSQDIIEAGVLHVQGPDDKEPRPARNSTEVWTALGAKVQKLQGMYWLALIRLKRKVSDEMRDKFIEMTPEALRPIHLAAINSFNNAVEKGLDAEFIEKKTKEAGL